MTGGIDKMTKIAHQRVERSRGERKPERKTSVPDQDRTIGEKNADIRMTNARDAKREEGGAKSDSELFKADLAGRHKYS